MCLTCRKYNRIIQRLRRINTSAAKQKNSLLANIKPHVHSGQCSPNHFLQLVLYYVARKNMIRKTGCLSLIQQKNYYLSSFIFCFVIKLLIYIILICIFIFIFINLYLFKFFCTYVYST